MRQGRKQRSYEAERKLYPTAGASHHFSSEPGRYDRSSKQQSSISRVVAAVHYVMPPVNEKGSPARRAQLQNLLYALTTAKAA